MNNCEDFPGHTEDRNRLLDIDPNDDDDDGQTPVDVESGTNT